MRETRTTTRPVRRRLAWSAAATVAALAAALAAVTLLAPGAGATPAARPMRDRDLAAAVAQYPHIAGTRLDACRLCHPSGSYRLDPYGRDWSRNRRSFEAIEGMDSDNDGFENLVEINALTFPGDPDDFPQATATATVMPTSTITPTATASATSTATSPSPTATTEAKPTPGGMDWHTWLPMAFRHVGP